MSNKTPIEIANEAIVARMKGAPSAAVEGSESDPRNPNVTDKAAGERAEIEKEIAELEAANAAASGWGAAVGARHEHIQDLKRKLRQLDAEQNPTLRHGDPIIIRLKSGYERPGHYLGEFTTLAGERRVIVEHPHHIVHVYAPEQIERVKP